MMETTMAEKDLPGMFDRWRRGDPTQSEIEAVSAALDKGLSDPVAARSGIIMTTMILRAVANAHPPTGSVTRGEEAPKRRPGMQK